MAVFFIETTHDNEKLSRNERETVCADLINLVALTSRTSNYTSLCKLYLYLRISCVVKLAAY